MIILSIVMDGTNYQILAEPTDPLRSVVGHVLEKSGLTLPPGDEYVLHDGDGNLLDQAMLISDAGLSTGSTLMLQAGHERDGDRHPQR
jgi:hypothetical protein